MAQRVALCRSRSKGNSLRSLETHVELESVATINEKSQTCCVELNQRLEELQNQKEELSAKCATKAEEMRDLEAHLKLEREENKKLKQELKRKESEIKRLKSSIPKSGTVWFELQQKKAEIAVLHSEPCSKTSCVENEKELQRLRKELKHFREEPCMRNGCYKVRTEKSTLTQQLGQLKSEIRRSYEHDTKLQQQNIKFRERVDQISAELQTLREGKKSLQIEVEDKDAQLQDKDAQLQDKNTLINWQKRDLDALRKERKTLQEKIQDNKADLQDRDSKLQQQGTELQERVIQISRQQRELQTQKKEWDTQLQKRDTQIQQQGIELQEKATLIVRLETKLQQMEENRKQQQRMQEEEIKRLQTLLQQKAYDYKNQQARLQSDFELKKEKVLEDSRVERERMLSEKNELTREVERLTTLTCQGKDCPSIYLQIMTSDILETIGKVENKQTGERQSLGDVMASLASGQTSLSEQLQELWKQQQQLLQQRSSQSCAACSEKENQYSRLKEAYRQLQSQNEEYKAVTRDHQETIQELEKQLHSGQCQRPDCVKLRKEQRQKEVQQIGKMRSPGKDLDKQRVVEHDQLIHEFERLTTDPDGLLGVLEDTLHEHGDDTTFEAKRVLCALFQESYDRCKRAVFHEIKTQLESLFVVQSTAKSEEMEDASRGYGLLLHAFGLRTEEIRAKYSAKIKGKIYSEISQDESLHKVKDTLESSREDHFGKAIALAWKFVTLSNPLIVCQPKGFNTHIHSQEYGHWEKHAKECELIYTRPVIYRNYEGMLACKGWVANTVTSDRKSKCLLS